LNSGGDIGCAVHAAAEVDSHRRLKRAFEQGRALVAFDPAELRFGSDRGGRTPSRLLIAHAPAINPLGFPFDARTITLSIRLVVL